MWKTRTQARESEHVVKISDFWHVLKISNWNPTLYIKYCLVLPLRKSISRSQFLATWKFSPFSFVVLSKPNSQPESYAYVTELLNTRQAQHRKVSWTHSVKASDSFFKDFFPAVTICLSFIFLRKQVVSLLLASDIPYNSRGIHPCYCFHRTWVYMYRSSL